MKLRASSSMEAPAFGWEVRSEVVERERILRGWTRTQLTQAADIDPKTLRDLLTGRRRPTLGTLNTLSRALGMPLSEVITVVERPRPPGRSRSGRSAPSAQALLPLQ
ncbi:MAG: helix-turn-helix domain-containing protein [Candidatus Dormibacteria bacterium]